MGMDICQILFAGRVMKTASNYSPNASQLEYINENYLSDTRLIAPAGCGKTMTLLHRAERIVDELRKTGISNPKVLIVTFTNAAKMELIKKIKENHFSSDSIVISTLNKLGADLIHKQTENKHHLNPIYVDNSDIEMRSKWYYHCVKQLLENDDRFEDLWCYLRVDGKLDNENRYQLLDLVDCLKDTGIDINKCVEPSACLETLNEMKENGDISSATYVGVWEAIETFIPLFQWRTKNITEEGYDLVASFLQLFMEITESQYEELKPRFFSFEDQKYWPLYMMRKGENLGLDRFNAVFVDEFQDINSLDLSLIKSIREASERRNGHCSISIVGDVDQAIFEWRGAVTNYILNPIKHFPGIKTYQLDINYRMPANIVTHSQKLISYNPIDGYKRKQVIPNKKENADIRILRGSTPVAVSGEVIKMVQDSVQLGDSVALLGRKRSQLILYQILLIERGMPFYVDDDLNIAYSQVFGLLLDSLLFHESSTVLSEEQSVDYQLDILFFFASMWGRYVWSDKRKSMITRDIVRNLSSRCSFADVLEYCSQRYSQYTAGHVIANIEKICRDITEYFQAKSIADALNILATRFDRFKKNCMTRDEEDIFNLDPPFELLQDYAKEFGGDFKSFRDKVLKARDRIIEINENKDRFAIVPGMAYIMTATRSKGREFDHVVMLDCVDKIWPCSGPVGAKRNPKEERRIFYVAMTRAKQSLVLTVPESFAGISVSPSPFIIESELQR